jgi:hypothetical protein
LVNCNSDDDSQQGRHAGADRDFFPEFHVSVAIRGNCRPIRRIRIRAESQPSLRTIPPESLAHILGYDPADRKVPME